MSGLKPPSTPKLTAKRILTVLAVAALVVAAFLLSGCSDRQGATDAVEAFGFTDVTITGHSWYGCSESDDYSTGFQATNDRGDRVEGVACTAWGYGKGGTVRIFRIIRRANPALAPALPLAN